MIEINLFYCSQTQTDRSQIHQLISELKIAHLNCSFKD